MQWWQPQSWPGGGWALPLGADWVRWGTQHPKSQEESLPREVNAHLMVLALNWEEESLSFRQWSLSYMKFLLDKKSGEQNPEPGCCLSFFPPQEIPVWDANAADLLKATHSVHSKDQQIKTPLKYSALLAWCQQDHSLICYAATARKMQTAMAAYMNLQSQPQLSVYAVVNTTEIG